MSVTGIHNGGSLARLILGGVGALVLVVVCATDSVMGSDHADPIMVRFVGRPESNLTGLFGFEQNDKLVIALCARPGLAENSPSLFPHNFAIHIDCDSDVSYSDDKEEDEGRTFRYGGYVSEPDKIKEDITFHFRFDVYKTNNPFESVKPGKTISLTPEISITTNTVKRKVVTDNIRTWVGLRDDPFILHGFSTTNVVAMVVEIPFEAFGKQEDLLIWGTSSRHSKQIDHIGRSLRTMLPRFDFLNGLHPSKHVAEIKRRHENPDVMQDLMTFAISPLFAIRHYDFEPDVMIFCRKRWQKKLLNEDGVASDVDINNYEVVAFPNGRRLTDDVAKLMCDRGDCLLFEVSTAEAHADGEPRPDKNGTPFVNEFPYIAQPNKNPLAAEMPTLRLRTKIIVGSLILGAVGLFLLPWFLYLRARRKRLLLQNAL